MKTLIKFERQNSLPFEDFEQGREIMLKAKINSTPALDKTRKEWVQPCLMVYGDMAALTQQDCQPHADCKPKQRGFADDFGSHFSTLGG